MQQVTTKIKAIGPGLLVCMSIGLVGQSIGRVFPQIGGSLFAILIGIIAGNTIFTQDKLNIGVRFSESKLLEYSIALTGLTLNLGDVMSVGVSGIAFIMLQMFFTIIIAYRLGKAFGFSRKFSLLMCAGNAVCGSSAIGTVAPILEADEKDKGIAITVVNLTGTVLMVLLPILTGLVYHHETLPTSSMIGGVLQSIGQVIASGKLVNDEVTQFATIFKILRIVLLVVVALSFSKMNASNEGSLFKKNDQKHSVRKVGVPWFISTFFIFCLIITFIGLPKSVSGGAKLISGQFEVIALAGIGMRVKFKDLVKEGPKAMVYGSVVGGSQVIIALCLIYLLIRR